MILNWILIKYQKKKKKFNNEFDVCSCNFKAKHSDSFINMFYFTFLS